MKINQRGAEEKRERERKKQSESYKVLDGSMEGFLLKMSEENHNHAAAKGNNIRNREIQKISRMLLLIALAVGQRARNWPQKGPKHWHSYSGKATSRF